MPNLHWIIVEDSEKPSGKIADLLKNVCVSYTHLHAPKPSKNIGRGAVQRNLGLNWIRQQFLGNVSAKTSWTQEPNGVVYFADDDNTYDLRLFGKMRQIKKVNTS